MRSWRRTISPIAMAAGSLMLTAVTAAPAAAASAAARPASHATTPPGAQLNDDLNGVSCASATDCMAVGSSGSGTLAELWNGHIWRVLEPSRAGQLAAVSCVSTGCMAVGNDSKGGVLAQWWNGSSWHVVDLKGAPAGDELLGVSCLSASNCMAVGSYVPDHAAFPISATWNGKSWRLRSLPSKGEVNYLNGVSCTSASSCMAVGFWTAVPDSSSYVALAEKWNGSSWSLAAPPAAAGKDLQGVSCPSASDCMAVGSAVKGSWVAEQWDGSTWKALPTQGTGGFGGMGVSCLSAGDCIAVGGLGGRSPQPALAQRWNGSSWQASKPVSPGTSSTQLNGVSCTSATNCVAAGNYSNARTTLNQGALTEIWNGSNWRIPAGSGYLEALANGGVSNFDAPWYGSLAGTRLPAPPAGIAGF